MRHLLLLGALALAPSLVGQITIGQADMPSAGDTMRYNTTLPAGVDVAATGPGYVWDYGDLTPLLPGADTAVAVSSTPFLYQFFFNNPILYPEHAASFAMKGMGFDLQGISVQNVFDYYKVGPTGYRNVGFGATINGLPASVRRIPVDWILRFPMDYGDEDDSFSTFEMDVPTIGFFGQTQMRTNVVDGWGTLYLPADTFEVLRVRSVLDRRDTVFVEQLGFGFAFDEPQTIEYKWYANGMDAPVLSVATVGGVPNAARYYSDPGNFVSVNGPDAPGSLPQLWPNPGQDRAFVRIPEGWQGFITLHDATGREVVAPLMARPGMLLPIDLQGLPAGAYVLRFQGAHTWTARLMVAR